MQSYSEIEPQIRHSDAKASPFSLGAGLLTWFLSVAFIVIPQIFLGVGYVFWVYQKTGVMPTAENIIDKPFAMLALGCTLFAHLVTLLFCWMLITKRLRLPFLQALGWGWHPQFKLPQAIILGLVLLGFAYACLRQVVAASRNRSGKDAQAGHERESADGDFGGVFCAFY